MSAADDIAVTFGLNRSCNVFACMIHVTTISRLSLSNAASAADFWLSVKCAQGCLVAELMQLQQSSKQQQKYQFKKKSRNEFWEKKLLVVAKPAV